jgi:fatty-acyl-CoA synthase
MSDHTIGRWLTDRAVLTPGRVAIDFHDRTLTYAELASNAAQRARSFVAAGLQPGDRVATITRNCPEHVEVFFACALAGLVLVPLNWRLTPAELAYQLSDAAPALLLEDLSERPVEPVNVTVTPPEDDAPLLILYTSGTTGKPKGAVLTHANCFWTNLSLDRTAEITSSDVVLQVLPQCHVGGWNVQPLLAWCKGATVVLEQAFSAGRVLDLIEAKRVTTMMGVPTNYLMLAQHPRFASADLSSLRQVIAGGAPMPLPLLEKWQARGVAIAQGYGLTEAAPNVLCVPGGYAREKAGSAGIPYPHVEVRLREGTGELLVKGPNVFAGYWRGASSLEDGWLATGDVAEQDADGFYWIKGRIKDMYISGGENVYPAEVEQVLAAYDRVAEAAVIGVPDPRWGETGLAFIVPAALVPGPSDLSAHCRAHLARYKVPAHFRFLRELPRLTSGKVDKVTLKEIARAEFG